MIKQYVNLCKHAVNLLDGTAIQPSGVIAEVKQWYSSFNEYGICQMEFGSVSGVPEPQDGVLYIVPLVVSQALPLRMDVVSPASNHPDTLRNEKGHILAVPGFIK